MTNTTDKPDKKPINRKLKKEIIQAKFEALRDKKIVRK